MPNTIFSGTTLECLKHYAKSLPAKKRNKTSRAREELAAFVGVQTEAVYNWTTGSHLPLSYNLVRLQYFLHSLGYDIKELKIDEIPYRWGMLIAYRKVDEAKLAKHLGITPEHLLRQIKGRNDFTQEAREKLESFTTDEMRNFLHEKISGKSSRPPQGAEPPVKSVAPQTNRSVIESAAALIKGLQPIANHLVSDSFSAQERDELRKLCGNDVIFKVSTDLERLCNEYVRNKNS